MPQTPPPIDNPAVAAVFAQYPVQLRARLLTLRTLIYAVAADTPGVGELNETLKWGQPAYLTAGGTTIRIDRHRHSETEYALYVNCQTNLVARFRKGHGARLRFEGNRAILFASDETLPREAVKHCVAAALTYHRKTNTRAKKTRAGKP